MTTQSSSARKDRGRSRRRRGPSAADPESLYYFDADAAERACAFFPRFLVHTKGEWAGRPFELGPWQRAVTGQIFGWKRRDNHLRRYRTVFIEVPKKNGKSTWAAGLGLYLLHCDDEPGAEIYSLAKDREQAGIVFNLGRSMSQKSPSLSARSTILRRTIYVPATESYYQVLSSDVPTKEGLNPHGILFDEMHVQDDRDLWNTVTTGLGARRQPLTIAMTTAGFNRKSLCGEMHDKALKVRDGLVRDDSFLPVVYAIDKGEDWEDPKVWARVNPNLGVSVKLDYLQQKYRDAKESPAFQNTFRRYFVNDWVQQSVRWIDQKKWAECAGAVDYHALPEKLRGRPCYAGLDLSTVTDLTALVLVFDSTIEAGEPDYPTEKQAENPKTGPPMPGWEYGDPLPAYDVLCWFWCPEEGIRMRAKKDRVPYDVWRDEGALIATGGDAVDQGFIRKFIEDLGQEYSIQEIAVDPWNAHKLSMELEEQGFTVLRMPQNFGTMTAPSKELDAIYRRRQIRHGGHPVLAWCADNVTLDIDPWDNWKPSKKRSPERIDGIVALVMALGRALLSRGTVEDARIETL